VTRYAAQTSVNSDRTRNEIEQTLKRYGATSFAYGWEGAKALIGFQMHDRRIRFVLPLPDPEERRFTHTPTGYVRAKDARHREYEQATRSRWRALLLVVKAKLEAVESGITTFEDEFLAHILLPDGRTYGEFAVPQLDHIYATGTMPRLLPGLTANEDEPMLLGSGR
jgi:hypothetical protein